MENQSQNGLREAHLFVCCEQRKKPYLPVRKKLLLRTQTPVEDVAKAELAPRTVKQVYLEYCEKGRTDRAYNTIHKQNSLWNNYLCEKFGKRFIDDISVGKVQDYIFYLYYEKNYAYWYVESFLKMFYLIFGQAYFRDYFSQIA